MIKKKLIKSAVLASVIAMMMTGVTGCGLSASDSGKDETKIEESNDRKDRDKDRDKDKDKDEDKDEDKDVDKDEDKDKDKDEDKDEDKDNNKESEGYESSEQVIKSFWKGMKNVDEDEIASCFYSLADAEDDIEDNYQLAKELLNYTTIHTQEIDIELEDDGDDAEDLVSEYGYKNYDAAEIYTVTVPLTQEIDDITYEVDDIYTMATVCFDDAWYLVEMKEIDTLITSQSGEENIDDDKPSSGNTHAHVSSVDGLSSTYADKNNRSFAINGNLYTLGVTTLQDLIDDGVIFTDAFKASKNVEPDNESEYIEIPLNDSDFYYCMISVGNFTNKDKTIADCPITSIYMSIQPDVDFIENTIEFAFPFDLTESQLRSNSGEPTYYDESDKDSSEYASHILEYDWNNKNTIGSSGYSFEFHNGEFYYVIMDYQP